MVNAAIRGRVWLAATLPLLALAPQISHAQLGGPYVVGQAPTNSLREPRTAQIEIPRPKNVEEIEAEPRRIELRYGGDTSNDAVGSSVAIPSLPESDIEKRILDSREIEAMIGGGDALEAHPQLVAPQVSGSSSYHHSYIPQTQYEARPQTSFCDVSNKRRFWVRGEALALWVQGDDVPALLTTGGTTLAYAGVLGEPNTRVLFGDDNLGQEVRLGTRISAGRWFKHIDNVGVQGEFTYIRENRTNQNFSSSGTPFLARPFFNSDPAVNANDASVLAFTPDVDGTLSFDTRSEIYSGNFGFRRVNFRWTDPCRGKHAEWISGFRYMRLAEQMRIGDNRNVTNAYADPFRTFAAGDTLDSFDLFKTQNDFYGFEMGTNVGWNRGRFSLDLLTKVALGVNHQLIEIDGSTTHTTGGVATTTAGGLLTSGGAIGQHARRRFSILPEIRANLGIQLSKRCALTLGYQFFMLTDAVRPGGQIDTNVNGTFINPGVANNGAASPTLPFASDIVFMHGATAGFEFRF